MKNHTYAPNNILTQEPQQTVYRLHQFTVPVIIIHELRADRGDGGALGGVSAAATPLSICTKAYLVYDEPAAASSTLRPPAPPVGWRGARSHRFRAGAGV